MRKEQQFQPPKVISHQPIQFETAQSWNPGKGNLNHPGTGNNGSNFPDTNPHHDGKNGIGNGVWKDNKGKGNK
ncbi:hypothetical protein [Paenibacillus sp.]|uniref:hypothetical protein n=1 Tax=Paenibacillus sp. TaxID=58172 RepID=UPI002810B783|nr:hypothetical protein [Paenibacillus sp.]